MSVRPVLPTCLDCKDPIVIATSDQIAKRICPDCDARRVARELAAKAGLPIFPVCALCQDDADVFEATQFRKTLSGTILCPDCYNGEPLATEPSAPTNTHDEGGEKSSPPAPEKAGNDPVDVAPRATEKSKGGVPSQPSTLAGDRAGGGGLRPLSFAELPAVLVQIADIGDIELPPLFRFRERRGSDPQWIGVEEWLFDLEGLLVATPQDVVVAALVATAGRDEWFTAFAVVHTFTVSEGIERRDVAGMFAPGPPAVLSCGSSEQGVTVGRTAAYSAAHAWAQSEALRLKVEGPSSYLPARREI